VVTGSEDGTAKIWELASGKELLTLRQDGGTIRSVAFSPDGERVLTGGVGQPVKMWEASSGRELLSLNSGHGGDVGAVAFAPDGQQIVTGSGDGIATIWKCASSEQVAAWRQEEVVAAELQTALEREGVAAAQRDRASRAQDSGAIKQWLILAPIAYQGRDEAAALAALDQQQLSRETSISPRAGERVKVGDIERTWEIVQLENYLLDINRLLGKPTNHSVAYALCYIHSERKQADLMMRIGTGDPLKVYLNEREIYRRENLRQAYMWNYADVMGVELKTGLNVLMLKVVNLRDDWRASIRLTDAGGQPVKGIRVTLEPPEEVRS
jgi:WD40 repeat protein